MCTWLGDIPPPCLREKAFPRTDYSLKPTALRGDTTMTQVQSQNTIVNAWSLIAFAKEHGSMKVAEFTNKETGEAFKSCAFVKDGSVCLVSFSSNLGELTPKGIVAMKDDLRVVELSSGSYKLCRGSKDAWQDVDLGI